MIDEKNRKPPPGRAGTAGRKAGREHEMTPEKIIKALQRAELKQYKVVGFSDDPHKIGVMVYHDYYGPYPDREAIQKHNTACRIAIKNGLRFEQRGYYTATLIYC